MYLRVWKSPRLEVASSFNSWHVILVWEKISIARVELLIVLTFLLKLRSPVSRTYYFLNIWFICLLISHFFLKNYVIFFFRILDIFIEETKNGEIRHGKQRESLPYFGPNQLWICHCSAILWTKPISRKSCRTIDNKSGCRWWFTTTSG